MNRLTLLLAVCLCCGIAAAEDAPVICGDAMLSVACARRGTDDWVPLSKDLKESFVTALGLAHEYGPADRPITQEGVAISPPAILFSFKVQMKDGMDCIVSICGDYTSVWLGKKMYVVAKDRGLALVEIGKKLHPTNK